jgi:hypothetical protein
VNALLYTMMVAWEQKHIAHHLQEIRHLPGDGPIAGPDASPPTSLAA